MFDELSAINARPALYSHVTTADLWTDPHISERMLAAHLDPDVDLSSNKHEFIDRATAWISERFDLRAGRHIADFGCGPGLYTNRLARTGAAVTGLDLSLRSLRHAEATAEQEVLPVRYLHQDYLSYRSTERYDLIIMIMRDYAALSPESRRQLLHTILHQLADGGAFLFDVDSAIAFDAVTEQASYAPYLMDRFWSAQPYFGFHNTYRYAQERVSLDKYEIIQDGGTRTYFNWVRYFTPDELTAELSDAGFEVTDLLGDVTGAPYDATAPQFAAIATPRNTAPDR